MSRIMLKTNLVLITIIFSLMIIACESGHDKIVLKFWAMGLEGETVSKLIPEFEKNNPGVKVIVQQIPWTAAHEKMITAFASETLPDVFQLGNTWVPEFRALGAISPLNEFINGSNIIADSNYFSGIWDTNVLDSTVFGIPWYVDTRLLFYRKDILESIGHKNAPKTWDELYDVSVKIKNKFNDKNKYAFFIPTNEWAPFIIFGLQNGAGLLKNNDSYGNFSDRLFRESFDYLAKFYYEGLAPIDLQQVLNLYQAFAEGYFSLYITGPWNVSEMQKRLPAELQDKWMTAPLPSPDSNYPGYSLAGGASLVLNKKSPNKYYAWKWIEFLSTKKIQLEFYNLVSSLPAVKSVWKDSTFTKNKYMTAFYDQLQKTKPTPKIPEWEQIVFSKIQQYAELVAANKLSTIKALTLLDKDVNKILEKRRWMLSNK
jgi:multiple sugar transport system substrate-binding protein